MRKRSLSVLALAALLVLPAQSPEPADGAQAWCTRIPLPHTGCRPLEVVVKGLPLRLAVAANEQQRERGLMNVREVPPGQGMIFVFTGGDLVREFWMKDTITPLDMVFVARDGTINAVDSNVPATKPRTPDNKVARRRAPATYVIELGAGAADALGLEPGAQLAIPPVRAQ